MKRFVFIPDSFKGSMSSSEVCTIMEEAVRRRHPDAQTVSIPVADGGEGSVDCFLSAVGGRKERVLVQSPRGQEMDAFYGILPDGTAVIEMAACAGLPLMGDRLDVAGATTYGVGQLIAHAVTAGVQKIVVGLGGSATNDGGCGAAAALGVQFLNSAGEHFIPVGSTLSEIVRIDCNLLLPQLRHVEMITMCDIDNPLCGRTGAAHIFGPQKGADPTMVKMLDAGLRHMAEIVKRDLGRDILELPGAGAAGGMGGGMVAFFDSKLQMGIETVLDTIGFDALLENTDMVFTGEGKIDTQSLRGKVVIGIARHTKRAGVPLVVIVGEIGDGIEAAYDMGVTSIFSINRAAEPFSEAKKRSKENLALTMDNLMRFAASIQNREGPA